MNKIYITLIIAAGFLACGQSQKESKSKESSVVTTHYYFIRHAEKDLSDPSNRDPKLTAEGEERAQEWMDYFADKDIDAVYSTKYERTMNTALPTANAKGLLIEYYDPSDMYNESFISATEGKNVVVVGHSNTTPFFANKALGEEKYEEIDESEYGHLYTVIIKDGVATSTHEEFD